MRLAARPHQPLEPHLSFCSLSGSNTLISKAYWQLAALRLHHMQRLGPQPDLISHVAINLGRFNHWQPSLALLRRMPSAAGALQRLPWRHGLKHLQEVAGFNAEMRQAPWRQRLLILELMRARGGA